MANPTQTIQKLALTVQILMGLLRGIRSGDIDPESALNKAETYWQDAADESEELRKLGHEE